MHRHALCFKALSPEFQGPSQVPVLAFEHLLTDELSSLPLGFSFLVGEKKKKYLLPCRLALLQAVLEKVLWVPLHPFHMWLAEASSERQN